jgi:hypothetical protein
LSRQTSCKNIEVWKVAVVRWIDRKAKRRNLSVQAPRPLSRFLYELSDRIAHAESREPGAENSASGIVAYFYCASRSGVIDRRVLEFIERARNCCRRDPRHNMSKALRLKKPISKRGNPGLVPGKRRRTKEQYLEARQIVADLIRAGKSEKFAVITASTDLGIPKSSIRRVISRPTRWLLDDEISANKPNKW